MIVGSSLIYKTENKILKTCKYICTSSLYNMIYVTNSILSIDSEIK